MLFLILFVCGILAFLLYIVIVMVIKYRKIKEFDKKFSQLKFIDNGKDNGLGEVARKKEDGKSTDR